MPRPSRKSSANNSSALDRVEPLIHEIRGEKVILDTDLARIYGIATFRLNEAVKRNRERFPEDFMFQLTTQETESLTSQIAISKKGGRGGRRTRPYAFTEHGAIMAANVLNSPRAVQMSVFVVRAFLKMRALLGDKRELAKQLAALSWRLTLIATSPSKNSKLPLKRRSVKVMTAMEMTPRKTIQRLCANKLGLKIPR